MSTPIAKVYESLVTLHVPRIGPETSRRLAIGQAGSVRHEPAIAETEQMVDGPETEEGTVVLVHATDFPTGLPAAEIGCSRTRCRPARKISVVNIMTFDYYLGSPRDIWPTRERRHRGGP